MSPALLETSAAAGGSGMIMMIVYMVIIFGVTQKKEQKRMAALLSTMEVGDTVVTNSGFYGTVIQVSEEDCIIEFGNNRNCRIPMRKSAIAEVEKASDGIADAQTAADKK